jgi:hypothetical protein
VRGSDLEKVSAATSGKATWPDRQIAFLRPLSAPLGAVVYGVLILFPIAMISLNHSSLTGMYEESVGYRYFYNLRTLYETTYLFLPQGDLVNLIFKGVHLLLSLAGYPATQLFPRIDLFSYLGVAFLQCLNLLCFCWATVPITSPFSRLSIALFWGGLNYVPTTSAIYTIMQPDYYVLFAAFSLLAMGSVLRTQAPVDWTPRRIAFFACFIGLALSVKFTVAILPAIALLHALIMSRWVHIGLVSAGLAALMGATIWCGIILVDAGGHPSFVVRHFRELFGYIQVNPGVTQSGLAWGDWFISRISLSPAMPSIIYGGPIIAGLTVLLARQKWEFAASVSFFLGIAVYGFFLFKRDYPNTVVECIFPLAALLVVVSQFRSVSALAVLKLPLIPILLWIVAWSYPRGVGSLIGSAGANTAEQLKLREVESGLRGKILLLVESNNDRPLSVDSAIMKGGIYGSGQWLDPPSKIMGTMFSNRDFRFMVNPNWPVLHLDDYGAVMFAYYGDLGKQIAELERVYAVPLATWKCELATVVSSASIAVCQPPGS